MLSSPSRRARLPTLPAQAFKKVEADCRHVRWAAGAASVVGDERLERRQRIADVESIGELIQPAL